MRTTVAILSLLLLFSTASAQYYLRGEVLDEKSSPLSNVRLLLHSTGYLYYSGSSGAYGIMSTKINDTLTITQDGYQPQTVALQAGRYQTIVLKALYPASTVRQNRLVSLTKNLSLEDRSNWTVSGETYSSLIENIFIPAGKYPETGCAIHTDKASYSNIRRFLSMNTPVPPDAVRTEEVLNYFNFGYTSPVKDSLFSFQSYYSDCPWNAANQLLFLHVCAQKIDPEKIPASNLVFLIDVSGSMDMPNRLPLLKSAFKLLVDNLRDKDTVSIVVYGSSVGVWLTPVSGKEKEKIRKAIEDLTPGGATAGESGIRTAFRVAKSQYIQGGNNRVILATDGDFNVGQSSEDELDKMITQHQQWGIYLTCLGVGMGNYKDSKLEILAKKGNGNFAYLDNEREAEKVLVKELTQTLYTVADDAYLNIQFNPDQVKEYRLLGFDNKVKALADSLTEVEGGEVGSGHSIMVMVEIVPVHPGAAVTQQALAHVNIHYKLPNDSMNRVAGYECRNDFTTFDKLPDAYRFASSIAMFTALLKNSKYFRTTTWSDVQMMASQNYNPNDLLQKEFVDIIARAKKIYGKLRKKKREGS